MIDDFWAHVPRPPAGVTPKEIRAWEHKAGVTLPRILREALERQNGGQIRDTELEVLPLAQIQPLADDFWAIAEFPEDEVPDRRLVFLFVTSQNSGECYALNYRSGAQAEPSVLQGWIGGDPYLRAEAALVMEFFERLLKAEDAPLFDWAKTEETAVLARETVDLSKMYEAPATLEQV